MDENEALKGSELVSLEEGWKRRSRRHVRCENVTVTTLDKFASQMQLGHLDVVKIDVEGFDGRAVMGAQNLLRARRITVMIFECCQWRPGTLGAPATTVEAFVALIHAAEDWGYHTVLLGSRTILWLSTSLYDDAQLQKFSRCGWCNFALVRAGNGLLQRISRIIGSMLEVDSAPCAVQILAK